MKTKNIYSLPVGKKDLDLAISDKRAHNKKHWEHAIDFILSEGTKILVAKGGIVIDVKDDSKKGGYEPKYDDIKYLNYIRVRHKNGEISEYSHLKHKGALVKKGDVIKEKQPIGLSGNTGYTTEPHLHFHVAKLDNPEKTLKIRFKEKLKVIRGPHINETN